MATRRRLGLFATCLLLTAGAPTVHAQWAVIDVGAIELTPFLAGRTIGWSLQA